MLFSKTTRIAALAMALSLVTPAALLFQSTTATAAEPDDPEGMLKEEWQRKYRNLLRDLARTQRNAEAGRKAYMKANRRNYPRGEARERILRDTEEAERMIGVLEGQVDQFQIDAREAGVRPGWLFDVEQEDFSKPMPAAKASNEDDDEVQDREGRNPRFFEDDDS